MVATSITHTIEARRRDIGSFAVRRLLPVAAQRQVGPFTFVDHMGPVLLPPGQGVDVPPHPHIGLATVTYLFEGELVHRDSLGSNQRVRPGDINWMNAGRGIVHSERSPDELRASASRIHGLQLWVALPVNQEASEPSFDHYPVASLPELKPSSSARIRVLAGTAFGLTSPVRRPSSLFYVDIELDPPASLELGPEHAERALYVVSGRARIDGVVLEPGRMVILATGATAGIEASEPTRLVALGGAALDGPRLLDWNFVASSPEPIVRARAQWQARCEGRPSEDFPPIPGDDHEFTPLPPSPRARPT